MPDFSFLHAADLHLDSPLRGLDAAAPAERIRGATRQALVNLVDLALERRVAFVLLAGDLYDGDWKDWRTGQFLVQQLGRLTREAIEIVGIRGNHDADEVLTRRLHVPGMLGAEQPETVRLAGVRVAVHGQSFATAAVMDNLALAYPPPLDDLFNIGLLHTACGSKEHGNYAPCSVADLAARGYDYWALGHVHNRAVLSQAPWIVFPGNVQGRHINEPGSKGATLVTVAAGRVQHVEHHALDVLRWLKLDVDATGAAGIDAVLNRVRVSLEPAMAEADGRMLAVRIALRGECAAHAAIARSPDALLQQLRGLAGELAELETPLWIEAVRIATRPAVDHAAMREQPGAVGSLIRALEQPVLVDGPMRAFVSDQLRRADGILDAAHPAHAIAEGHVPDEIVEQARAMLLAELARR